MRAERRNELCLVPADVVDIDRRAAERRAFAQPCNVRVEVARNEDGSVHVLAAYEARRALEIGRLAQLPARIAAEHVVTPLIVSRIERSVIRWRPADLGLQVNRLAGASAAPKRR